MSGAILTDGVTRLVILVGGVAIKLPRFDLGWKMGLHGLLANMQEREFSTLDVRLCPVLLCLWGGWALVMRRATPMKDEQWRRFRRTAEAWSGDLPVEAKRSSFGYLHGRAVAVDYGS